MGGFAIWWNLIVVAIEFVFRQKPEVISRTYNQHKGTFYETTEVTVADVAPNKVKVVEAAIKRIAGYYPLLEHAKLFHSSTNIRMDRV